MNSKAENLPADLLKADQLLQNPVLRLAYHLRTLPAGLPLIGATQVGWTGFWWGVGVASWLYASAAGLVWCFKWRVRRHVKRRLEQGGFCLRCLHPLSGRRICDCGEELPPVCYAKGACFSEHCPDCGKKLGRTRGSERCFECDHRRPLEGFEDRSGFFGLIIHQRGEELRQKMPHGWSEGGDGRWQSSFLHHAVLLRPMEDDQEPGALLSDLEFERVGHIWLSKGTRPGAWQRMIHLPTKKPPLLFFGDSRSEIGALAENYRGKVEFDVPLQKYLDHLAGLNPGFTRDILLP